jgi:hypothetical protein
MAIILTKVSDEMFEEAVRICKGKPRVYQVLDPMTSPLFKCKHDATKWYHSLHQNDRKRFVLIDEFEIFAHDLAKKDGTTIEGNWADRGEIIKSTSIMSYVFSKKQWIISTEQHKTI